MNGQYSTATPSALFDAWFDSATRGLCDFAKTQVREEYEDHFAAAYEDLRAKGLGEEEAERAAVGSLGDARKIRRQLKKVYLTWGEERELAPIRVSGNKIRFGRFGLLKRRAGRKTSDHSSSKTQLRFVLYALGLMVLGNIAGEKVFGSAAAFVGVCVAVIVVTVTREGILLLCGETSPEALSLGDALRGTAQGMVAAWFAFVGIPFWISGPGDWAGGGGTALLVELCGMGMFLLLSVPLLWWAIALQSIARKLRWYPTQNAAPVVMKLRKVYGGTAHDDMKS